MTTNLKSLGFSGPDGTYAVGEVFTVKNNRVDFLVSNGYAEVTKDAPTPDEEIAGAKGMPVEKTAGFEKKPVSGKSE